MRGRPGLESERLIDATGNGSRLRQRCALAARQLQHVLCVAAAMNCSPQTCAHSKQKPAARTSSRASKREASPMSSSASPGRWAFKPQSSQLGCNVVLPALMWRGLAGQDVQLAEQGLASRLTAVQGQEQVCLAQEVACGQPEDGRRQGQAGRQRFALLCT